MWLYLPAVIALLLSLAVTARKTPDTKTTPDYSIYHSEAQLMESVEQLVDSTSNMLIELPSHTENEYTAEVPIVTVMPHHEVEGEVLRVLVDFGEHAREFISADTGLHFLKLMAQKELLTAQFDTFRSKAGAASDTAALLAFLDCCVVLKVVPIENREGRKLIEQTGDFCERKNGHGVDPNRNWEVDWGKREKDYSAYEENAGLHAFSEPEAYILRNLVDDFKPHVWVNVHSGMDGLFMPYDHVDHIPDHPSSAHTLRILEELNTQACESKCVVGSGGKSVGYLAHGTATDYMYEKANVSIAMTWEIYGDQQAHFNDCFRMFNPLTQTGYDDIITAWTNALFVLLLEVQQHPDVAHLIFEAPQGSEDTEQQIQGISEDTVAASETNSIVHATVDIAAATETNSTRASEVQKLPAVDSTASHWMVKDVRYLDQEQVVWMRFVGVMFVMTIALWYALRAFLGRRKRLAKAATGRRESK